MICSSRPRVSGTALRNGTEPTRNGARDCSRPLSRFNAAARCSRSSRRATSSAVSRGAMRSLESEKSILLCGSKIAFEHCWPPRLVLRRFGNRAFSIPDFERLVKGVSLNRFTSGLANCLHHFRFGLQLRGSSACHMKNMLLENGPMEVVCAIAQSHLRQFQTHADPVGGDLIKIIE